MSTDTDFDFPTWLKSAMIDLYGDIDLYTNTEAEIIYKRAKFLYQKGASLQTIIDLLEKSPNPNYRYWRQ